ncbi:MAG: hypothetical protein ACOZIN_19125 [Myxococcota bacterium]
MSPPSPAGTSKHALACFTGVLQMSKPLLLALFALALAGGACQCAAPAQCVSDLDCDFPGKGRCEPLTGECVECVLPEQCPTGICRSDGTCAQCGHDEQCSAGQVCSTEGLCVPGCSDANGSCPVGMKCLPGSNACVECVEDGDCGVGRLCSEQNVCVPGCSAARPLCPSGLVCNVTSGACVACTADVDCQNPGLPRCDPATHQCVGCTQNSHCPQGAPVCNPVTHVCVACTSDSHCPSGFVCQANTCVPGCNASHSCPTGLVCDTSTGQCVSCLTDAQCNGARCNLSSHACVSCLPGPTDNCPSGFYCRPDFVCERGCKSNADCPSGQCLADHSCASCTSDGQCAAGKVCQGGACVDACGAQNPCGGSDSCCALRCVNTQSDVSHCGACGNVCAVGESCCNGTCVRLDTVQNCGACGNGCTLGEGCCTGNCQSLSTLISCGGCNVACPADHFCDGAACRPQTFPNFCANRRVFVIYDGIAIDDGAANVLASTIVQNCSTQTQLTYSQQTNPALVDQTTGAPLAGSGATYVLAGGPWPSKVVKWLERTRQTTKIYFDQNGTTELYFKKRADGTTVSTLPQAQCSPGKDHFVVELVTDPVNGTLALISYGACSGGYGTQAGAWFWANVMLPSRASYPDSWYVFEWVDGNGDATANTGDTFTQLASGQ